MASPRDMYGYNGEKLEYRFFVAGPFRCEDDRTEMLAFIDLFRQSVSQTPIEPIVRGILKPAGMPSEMLQD